ncbi:ABC transporter substrate-binding protein [Corynebacterium sp. HMSC067D03]|uniref:TIGR04028 family ABC transporter substrate-binding protein n=1 Tax=unclassified Corynebacterium TaxID=2624378 RepID=UPI0008A29F34|nr:MULTISPECIES: TIGR04028 family ABC transporter substrate-binding protein [unclassified Corynebacterium]OFL14445.1 ABC transporter substrate-binding protein [Corynebacterium sp. HMSC067D03]OHO77439.1 ABC transporter substrate-binding protein [Corynebacterium sp. HMSC036E10]
MPKKTVAAPVVLVGAVALLSGCTAGGGAESHAEGDNVLTYLESNWFNSLYPPAAGFYPNGGVVNQLTDRLLYQDPETLELQPWIATDLPEINEDATVFTFDIRTDVTYSDGTPMTAQNIVDNFDLYGQGDKDRLLNVSEQISNYDYGEVVDEDTVRFHFTAPSPGFAQATSSYNAGLLADSSLQLRNEDFGPGGAANVIGSGPFVVDSETLGTDLVLKTREDYDWAPPSLEHQGRARIDGIHYTFAAEEAVRSGALLSGQADAARTISPPVERHLKDQGVQVVASATNGMNNQLAMRFNHPLLQDIRVRKAIIHGINREEIIRILLSDSYPLATSSMTSSALGYAEQPGAYTFDPDQARALLHDAGWTPGPDGIRVKDGQRLSLSVNHALPQPRSKEIVTMVQSDLRDLGIELNMVAGDRATQNAAQKDINRVQLMHTMVGRADYDVIESHLSVNRRDSLLNNAGDGTPVDAKLEELLQKVVSTPDDAGRAAASKAVQDYLTEQAYVLPLFEEPQVYALAPHVKGFVTESVARPSFYSVYFDRDGEDN